VAAWRAAIDPADLAAVLQVVAAIGPISAVDLKLAAGPPVAIG